MLKRIFISFVLILILLKILSAHEREIFSRYVVKTFNNRNGFPSGMVKDIYQDDKGFIWFATQENIARFDGSDFETLNKEIQRISCFLYVQGNMYLGTFNQGLLSLKNKKITQLKHKNQNIHERIMDLEEGEDKSIWIGTVKGLYLLKNNEVSRINLVDNMQPEPCVYDIIFEKEKKVTYLGTSQGLIVLKGDKVSFVHFKGLKIKVLKLALESDDSIWLGTDKGLINIDSNLKLKKHYTNKDGLKANIIYSLSYRSPYGLLIGTIKGTSILRNGNFINPPIQDYDIGPISSVLIDNDGNYWIGGSSGAKMFYKGNVSSLFVKRNRLSWSIYEMKNGEIWVGTTKGIFVIKNNRIIREIEELKGIKVKAIFQDTKNRIFIGSDEGAFIIEANETKPKNFNIKGEGSQPVVKCFAEDSQGDIWVGTTDGLIQLNNNGKFIKKWGVKDGLHSNIIGTLYNDFEEKSLWIATQKGLFKLQDFKIKEVFADEDIYKRHCYSIYKDKQGYFWISLYGALAVFKDNKHLYTFRLEDGVINNFLYQLVEDKSGNLWMSSNEGIFFISKESLFEKMKNPRKKLDFFHISEFDGMENKECNGGNQCSGLLSKKGFLYFINIKGVCIIDPLKYRKIENTFNIYINSLLVDNKTMKYDRKRMYIPEIKYSSKKISFNMSKVCFRQANEVHLEYMLQGYDNVWYKNKDSLNIFYTNLSPGDYVFKVKAVDNITGKTKQDRIAFKIIPLFYQTIYFKLLLFLVFLLFVWWLILLRTRLLNKRKKELERLVHLKTKELKEATLKDHLTGLYNRRYMVEVIDDEFQAFISSQKYCLTNKKKDKREHLIYDKKVFGIIMLDIDYFKKINDTYGHDAGDMILKQFSEVLRKSIRKSDVVIRWGGEEFLVVLKKSDRDYLQVYAKKLYSLVQDTEFQIADGKKINVTFSGGIVGAPFYDLSPEVFTFDEFLILIDSALYYSKNNNRNRISIVESTEKMIPQKQIPLLLKDLDWADKNGYIKLTVVKGK